MDRVVMPSAAARVRRVALVGNPNAGKTALFNRLTGSRQKVAKRRQMSSSAWSMPRICVCICVSYWSCEPWGGRCWWP